MARSMEEAVERRGRLTVTQAVAWWLCMDPYGPGLTRPAAAMQMGCKAGQEVSMHLAAARRKLGVAIGTKHSL